MDAQNLKHTTIFTGGINTDDADELMPAEDYRDGFNIFNGNNEQATHGIIENLKGSEKIIVQLPAGTNRCIGIGTDTRESSLYYFIYNSNENHCIFRYFETTKSVVRVIYPIPGTSTRFLGFQNLPAFRIYHVDVIYKSHDQIILCWADGYGEEIALPFDNTLPPAQRQVPKFNQPRSINATLAQNFTNGTGFPAYSAELGVDNPEVQLQFVNACPYPPLEPPTVEFISNPLRNTNFFRKYPTEDDIGISLTLPQFMYRYVYFDNQKSTWSPISKVALPPDDENILGVYAFNNFKNNAVRMTFETGHPTVVQIELAVRFGNIGAWQIFFKADCYEDLENYPNGNIIPPFSGGTFDFYNDQVLQVIDDNSVTLQYNAIPIVAKAQSYTSANVMAYGNIIEGYTNPALNVTVSYERETPTLLPVENSGTTGADNAFYEDFNGAFPPWDVDLYVPFALNISEGTLIQLTFSSGKIINHIVTAAEITGYPSVLATNLQTDISNYYNTQPFTYTTSITTQTVSGFQYLRIRFNITTVAFSNISDVNVYNPIQKFVSYKQGAYHNIGIGYSDGQGRYSAVAEVQATKIYVPYATEDPGLMGSNYRAVDYYLLLDIAHEAPKWAKECIIYYGRTNIRKFVQTTIHSIADNGAGTKVEIDISPLLNGFQEDNKPTPINYTFESGDRIRFITNANSVSFLSSYIDVRIQDLDTTSFILTVDLFDWAAAGIAGGALVELYGLKQTAETQLYWEIGETFPVEYSQADNAYYHTGNVRNQTSSQSAVIRLDAGDVYVKRRQYVDSPNPTFQGPVESEHFSDFYPSADIDIGRANANINNSSQKQLANLIRHGNKFFPETNINGLFMFAPNDYISVDITRGGITKMLQNGYVLKYIQERGYGSIYVQRRIINQPDGTENLAVTDTVLGTYNPSATSYGTIFPGSVVKHDNHLYWFDPYNQCFVRDSYNGPFQISDYKFINGARAIAQELLQSTHKERFDVVGGFDIYKGTYEFTVDNFNGATGINSRTIAFHEGKNRFVTRWGYYPEMYGILGPNVALHFKNGEAWLLRESDNYTNFFGVQQVQQIRIIPNSAPNKTKVWQNITLKGNQKWRAAGPNGEYYIIIPAWELYQQGMASRILESKFNINQGGIHANFMYDALTPNMPSEEYAIVNGRGLTGPVIDITLENDKSVYVKLFMVETFATTQEVS